MVLLAASAVAQLRGTPASVTSTGTPGKGMAPGVPASVTSNRFNLQGPDNCCNFPTPLIPSAMGFRNPAFNPGGREFHLHPRSNRANVVPYYVPYPYAVPVYPDYEVEQQPEGQQSQYEPYEPDPPAPTIFERRPVSAVPASARAAQPEPEPAAAGVASGAEPERPQEPTMLVFKDGTRLEIQNFAIVGDVVFELSPDYRKIPLAELDLPATVKENDVRGADFHVPVHKGS